MLVAAHIEKRADPSPGPKIMTQKQLSFSD